MASARLQIIVDGDSEDGKKALDDISRALGDLDKTTKDSEKTQQSFWESTAAVAVGGVIAEGINALAGGIGSIVQGMGEVASAVSDAKTVFGDLASEVDMNSLLNDAALLSSRFGVDTAESVAAVNTLMREFGMTSTEASDFLIAGFEKGLNTSGDFLDSVGEYSNLMADNGFAAEEFFSIMQTGMAGGPLGTDKAADAFKEFGIRINEMGDDIFGPEGVLRTTMGMTDDDITALYEGMQDGSVSVADAYKTIIPQLAAIEDPIARNAAGVALFGTQWEDLGASAIIGINAAETGLGDIADAASVSRDSIATLGEIGPRVMTFITAKLLPLNDAAVAFVNALYNAQNPFQAFIDALMAAGWTDMANGLQAVYDALAPIVAFVMENREAFVAAITAFAAVITVAFIPALWGMASAAAAAAAAAIAPFLPLIAIAAAVAAVAYVVVDNWDVLVKAFETAGGGIEGVGAALGTLAGIIWDWISSALGPLLTALADWAEALWQWIVDSWPGVVEQLGVWWGKFTDWLKGLPAKIGPFMVTAGEAMIDWIGGLWDLAKPHLEDWWGDLKTWFEGLPESVKTVAGNIGSALIDGIIDGVTKMKDSMFDALKGVVDGALSGVMQFFGIESPSTVFRDEVGMQLGAGVAEGIIGSIGQVRAASTALSAAALTGAGRGLSATAAQQSITYNYNYAPVYSAVPSNPSADFQLMQSLARAV